MYFRYVYIIGRFWIGCDALKAAGYILIWFVLLVYAMLGFNIKDLVDGLWLTDTIIILLVFLFRLKLKKKIKFSELGYASVFRQGKQLIWPKNQMELLSVTGWWVGITLCKESTELDASLPEDGNRAGFRNVYFYKNLEHGQSPSEWDWQWREVPTWCNNYDLLS